MIYDVTFLRNKIVTVKLKLLMLERIKADQIWHDKC